MHASHAALGQTLRRLGENRTVVVTRASYVAHTLRVRLRPRVTHVTTPVEWDCGEIAWSCKSSRMTVDRARRAHHRLRDLNPPEECQC